jgi:hypothetical protein
VKADAPEVHAARRLDRDGPSELASDKVQRLAVTTVVGVAYEAIAEVEHDLHTSVGHNWFRRAAGVCNALETPDTPDMIREGGGDFGLVVSKHGPGREFAFLQDRGGMVGDPPGSPSADSIGATITPPASRMQRTP